MRRRRVRSFRSSPRPSRRYIPVRPQPRPRRGTLANATRTWGLGATAALIIGAGCAPAPSARDALLEATEAIRTIQSASYRYSYEGSGSLAGSYAGDVVIVRPSEGGFIYHAELRPSPFATGSFADDGEAPALFLSSGGDNVAARDEALRRFSYGTVSGGSGHLVANAAYAVLFQLGQADPFAVELDGELAFEGQETIDGVLCDVVRATNPTFGGADIRWYLGVEDRLPRGQDWLVTQEGADGEFRFRLTDLVIDAPIPFQRVALAQGPDDEVVDEDARQVRPGVAAPDWELEGLDGSRVRLSDLRGEVVVLDLWASWCPPCRALMPEFDRLSGAYEGRGVRFFAVNAWESPDVSPGEHMRERALRYPVLLAGERLAFDYKVVTLPALFVIDEDGILAYQQNPVARGAAETAAEVAEAIERLLGR